jgi:hypothetical protein
VSRNFRRSVLVVLTAWAAVVASGLDSQHLRGQLDQSVSCFRDSVITIVSAQRRPAGSIFGCLRVAFGPAGSLDRVEHRLDLVDESTSSS